MASVKGCGAIPTGRMDRIPTRIDNAGAIPPPDPWRHSHKSLRHRMLRQRLTPTVSVVLYRNVTGLYQNVAARVTQQTLELHGALSYFENRSACPHFEVRRGKNNSCLGPELAGYGDLGGALLSARERTSARSRSMVERIFDQPEFRSEPNETMSG